MATVGIDSIVFSRPGLLGRLFKAPLGLALTIPDEDKFKRSYDNALDLLFKRVEKTRVKRIYKAAHLTAQLLHLEHDVLRGFISEICPAIQRLDFFYTFFPTAKIPKVFVFADSTPRGVPPVEFIELIQNAYPHICVWAYLQFYSDCRAYRFRVDHFHGKKSPAWDEIDNLPDFKIYFSGDECNMAISTADLLLRWVQDTLQGALRHDTIEACFGDVSDGTHVMAHYLGPKREYLHKMAPNLALDINISDHIKHPIYILAWKSLTARAEEKKSFEWTAFYTKAMQRACEADGCVKFRDPAKDHHIIDESIDKVLVCDEASRPIADAIRRTHPKIAVEFPQGK